MKQRFIKQAFFIIAIYKMMYEKNLEWKLQQES